MMTAMSAAMFSVVPTLLNRARNLVGMEERKQWIIIMKQVRRKTW